MVKGGGKIKSSPFSTEDELDLVKVSIDRKTTGFRQRKKKNSGDYKL
jgi:hypothetical protein